MTSRLFPLYSLRDRRQESGARTREGLWPRYAEELLTGEARSNSLATLPLFNAFGMEIGKIPLEKALALHGSQLELRAKGTGRKRRFTSAKLFPVVSRLWLPQLSGGFVVLQLITSDKVKAKRRK